MASVPEGRGGSDELIKVKREIAKLIGVSERQLEEMIDNIRKEAPELITERLALLILAEKHGITSPELLGKLLSEYSFMRIGELERGMRGVNIIGRIVRIIEPLSKSTDSITAILDDGSGKAIVNFQGRNVTIFRKLELAKGDIISVRGARVSGMLRGMPIIVADDKAEITYVDEADLQLRYGVHSIPPLPPPYSVKDVINLAPELAKEGQEVEVKGVLVHRFSEVRVTRSRDGRQLRKRVFKLADPEDMSVVISLVAWESAIDRMGKYHLGDILIVEGCSVKEAQLRGREEYELHAGNLTAVRRVGELWKRIAEANVGSRGVFYVYAISRAILREFEKNGNLRRMAHLLVADDTGVARLVVWDEGILDEILRIGKGTRLRVFGSVREGVRTEKEIHVSRGDEIIISPTNFPDIHPKTVAHKEEREVISKFEGLSWGTEYNVRGRLVKFERKGQRLLGVAEIADEDGRVMPVMIWENEGLVEMLEKVHPGTDIILYNVRTPKKGNGEIRVFFAGSRTRIEILERKTGELPRLLREAKPDSSGRFIGTVTEIVDYGTKIFCDVCGGLAIRRMDDKYICEFGHETIGVRKTVLRIIIDDDKKSAEVFIPDSLLGKLGISPSPRIIEQAQLALLAKEIMITGRVYEAPLTSGTDVRIFADDVELAPVEVLEAIATKLEAEADSAP